MSQIENHPVVKVEYPDWVDSVVDWNATYPTDAERMRLAIAISRENVERESGGPFGAAVFESESGRVVAVGMNSVVRLSNCTLHGEMVAFMMAQQKVGSFSLNGPGLPIHELHTSCEPCAMCLGATLWSGVQRVVYGAAREDASVLNFDEAPCSPSRTSISRRGESRSSGTFSVTKRAPFSSSTAVKAGRSTTADPLAQRHLLTTLG